MVRVTDTHVEPANGDFIVDGGAVSVRAPRQHRIVRVTRVGSLAAADFGDDIESARLYACTQAQRLGTRALQKQGATYRALSLDL